MSKQQSANIKQSPRWLAMEAVYHILFKDAFIHEEIHSILQQETLDSRDRALTTQLIYGTVQNYLTLDAMLKRYVKKANRVKKWLWALLLVSVYQRYYLTSIPEYAIVDEAVWMTKKRGDPTLSRFTNGVLRRLFREVESHDAFIDSLDSLPWDERLSIRYSLPKIWVNYLEQRFGRERAECMAHALLEPAPITIRVTKKAYPREEALISALEDQGFALTPSEITPHAYRLDKGTPIETAAFLSGDITIQDASAQLAAVALDAQVGEKVLDACAAPGGKTVQLAEEVGLSGQVISGDIQENKLSKIEENIKRTQVAHQVTLKVHDATQLEKDYGTAAFDRILVDAPCSGAGLFRRKPDTKYHKTLQDLKQLQAIQLDILEAAQKALKPGGTLVYSTCTITKEENAEVVSKFLAAHPQMESVSISIDKEALKSAVTEQNTIEILPDDYHSDGFFIAKFQKQE